MIGRDGKLKPFELIRWARQQARDRQLKPIEAHLLLVLATYANDEGVAWPSLRTLAEDCGLKPTARGRHSSLSAAMSRLEEAGLIWSKQGGAGRTASRELLWNPERSPLRETYEQREAARVPGQPSRPRDISVPSAGTLTTSGTATEELPNGTAKDASPDRGKQSIPRQGRKKKGSLRHVSAAFADIGLEGAAA